MTDGSVMTSEQPEGTGQARALGLFLSERYEEAAAFYDELLAQDPDNMVFRENRMICQAEYLPAAEDFITQMMFEASDLSSAGNLCLANALYNEGRNSEAGEYADKALEQNPDNADAAVIKALVLQEEGRDAELFDFMRSLYPRLNEDDRILCLAANYIAAFGNERQVSWMLRKALKINRPSVLGNRLFYQTLFDAGRFRDVIDYALDAAEISEKNLLAWQMLAEAATREEEYELADKAYTVLCQKKTLSEEQLLGWAGVQLKIGKYEEAFANMCDLPQDSDEWLKQLLILFQSMKNSGLVKKCREKASVLLKKEPVSESTRFICDMFLQNDRKEPMPLSVIRMMNDVNAFSMREALDHPSYLGPFLLENMLQQLEVSIGGSLKTLDLGCGVGNLAVILEKFRRPSGILDGVDISAETLNYAAELNKYDTLNEEDIVSFCKNKENEKRYDLTVCINVFQYFSDLTQVFEAVESVLVPGGLFIFSVLPLEDSEKQFEFQESGAFWHNPDYVSERLRHAGLTEEAQSKEILFRFEQEYPCYVFAARKKK